MTRLRLFPLRTVLFPGMALSLQVFEERYRILVAECLDAAEPFGVALIKEGDEVGGTAVTHSVGCTAQIRSIWPSRDGRLMLRTTGGRRFRIVQRLDDAPYPAADVEFPVDEVTDVPPEAFDATRERFRQFHRLRDTLAGEYHREPHVPDTPGVLADAVGTAARGLVSERQLQSLLATLNVRRRFDLADEILTALVSATHEQAAAAVAQHWAGVERRN